MGIQNIHSRYTRSLARSVDDLRVRRHYLANKCTRSQEYRANEIKGIDSEVTRINLEIESHLKEKRRRTWT